MRALRCVFALEPLPHPPFDFVPARAAIVVVGQLERLPATIELDRRRHDRSRLRDQCLGLPQQQIRRRGILGAALERLQPAPSDPRHAPILVTGGVCKSAQCVRAMDTLGRREAHRCMRGRDGEFGQNLLVPDGVDRAAPAFRLPRMHGGHGTGGIRAIGGAENGLRRRSVRGLRQHLAQRGDDRRAHGRLRFDLHGRAERARIDAARGRGGAHFGRGVALKQLNEHGRLRRQCGHAEHALRGVGVFMQGQSKELVEHVGDLGGGRGELDAFARQHRWYSLVRCRAIT